MLTIHPPAFVETGGPCTGQRYIRGQPSRENGGVLMSDIQDKYVAEFELPYRNILRYIKEIGNNWNRLDSKQREAIKKSMEEMGLQKETFGNVTSGTVGPSSGTVGPSSGPSSGQNIQNFVQYLATDPQYNSRLFMDTIWNTPSKDAGTLGISKEQLEQIKDSMYEWSVDNTYVLHSNWRSGLVLFFFLLIIIILIIVAATGNYPEGSQGFGKSLFGRRRF